MDDLDRSIVRLLERHGRLSQEELARRIRLSRPAVHQRVKRLEAARVIRGYRAELDWAALGLPLTVFVWVRTGGPNCAPVGPAILGLGDDGALVEEVHRVTKPRIDASLRLIDDQVAALARQLLSRVELRTIRS